MVNLVRPVKIYTAALACFSVHSGVPFHPLHGGRVWARDYDSFLLMREWGLGTGEPGYSTIVRFKALI